ncbi:hypothetical protein Tco_0882348 [Tanacetum coccineum]
MLSADGKTMAIPAPVQAPQEPPPPPPAVAKTMPQRMARLEEDVHKIRGALTEQREVFNIVLNDPSNLPLKVGFPEFFKELEAEILGAGAQLIGLQFLQLELRLGKTPSRSFRPVKSAEIFMQLGFSPFGASLSKIVLGARGALLVVEG